MRFDRKELGVAVIGAGRIGTHRSRLAVQHPAVRFLAISDLEPERAEALGNRVGAQVTSGSNEEVIAHPDVNAVIVSTSEFAHVEPILQALELGKPVLVEKPIAMSLEDADRVLSAMEKNKGDLRVGYIMRYKRQYFLGKEQIDEGRLGRLVGATGRVFNSRAQALEILKRSADATPVLDVLTYYVDMMCWFMKGNRPVEVICRGHGIVFKEAGYPKADDVSWAIITFEDGAVVSLGICYSLPAKYPTAGQSVRLEIIGTDGVLMFDEDHKENILYTEKGYPHAYVPGHSLPMVFLGSTSSGDWALDNMYGPIGDETRGWLDYLSTGRPCHLATAAEARQTLEVTIAMEKSAHTGEVVKLPLGEGY
ncbi:MAG: Gfo/Idh/MocA family oxidoreductase [Nitrospinaceae bacterium]|jgi:predicted dehydrogenase|nr:Gfo/Idh/MocA family oxidoreductase [Nitrospinaceae bacterium]MBT3433245.1 Gfo/Idh/MocA family oxidoreductase [Nitrospinaceae bacterium]MBT4095707.1 Gfo/Idh/MocA family oxidoreductase [Nitrospinaceae bacterium]MBT4431268.1 Gfo/Idh/MocA family oxidoreductase [Nitrospinaceae bacterium]MBT5368292.1 Gfo/Idh/MocA family oxidoreductase [Nitrospinaceae bacterium]